MSILDPKFRYTPAVETDIKKTFARVRKQLAEQQKRDAAAKIEAERKVRNIVVGGKK